MKYYIFGPDWLCFDPDLSAMQMQQVYPLAGSTMCSAIYISIVSFRQPLLTSVNAILLGKVDLGECTRDGYLMVH